MANEYLHSSLRFLTFPCSSLSISLLLQFLLPNLIFYCGPLNSFWFILLAFPASLGTVIVGLLITFGTPTHYLLLSYFIMVIAMKSIFVGFVMGSWVAIPNSEADVNWAEMEGCLRASEICGRFQEQLYVTSMKSIMVDCCKEPASLSESCRVAVFNRIKSNWKIVNIASTIIVGLLLLVYNNHVYLYGSSIRQLRW